MRRIHSLRRESRATPRGFTLVELAMTSVIVVILALIAAPRYTRGLQRYRAEAAARRIALDVDLARQAAINASATRNVFFDSLTTSYLIPGVDHLDRRSVNYSVKLTQPPYQADLLLVTFTDVSKTFLSFDGYGNPNSGATITVRAGTEQRTVVVDAASGGATVP